MIMSDTAENIAVEVGIISPLCITYFYAQNMIFKTAAFYTFNLLAQNPVVVLKPLQMKAKK